MGVNRVCAAYRALVRYGSESREYVRAYNALNKLELHTLARVMAAKVA